ncbi:MAG: GWxTD domain-containing protein [Gemmatimonadetes bacterium]|nr:GWxTD domain-containing protein [Gemmatimonadota bacterium]
MFGKIAGPALMLGLTAAGCSSWQRVGSEQQPAPEIVVPGLFEPSGAYRDMGFLAHGAPVAFVGAVRFLAGSGADSTLTLFSLSMTNSTLSFQREGTLFQASYRVEAAFRSGSSTRQITSDQTVRVAGFSETQRADESVIFQQYLSLPPGDATVTLVVRDQNSGGYSRDERTIRVPRFASRPALSSVVPFYRGRARAARTERPELVVNPRSTIPYGADTLQLYVELYGSLSDSALVVRALDEGENEVWRSTVASTGDTLLRTAVIRVPPGQLPIGRLRVEGVAAGVPDTSRAPVLVSFSDQWAVANFEGVLNLLRYFGADEAIHEMRAAPDSSRSALWRTFWQDTDPNPITPENEALQQYFSRLQTANTRFREGTDPGWLTDRGEVFITLGEPDEIFDQSSDLQGQRRFIRWSYTNERLVVDFVDESGFGRFRMSPSSRAEFQRIVTRVRRRL